MSTYKHLPGVVAYAQDWTTAFDVTVTDGVTPRTESITLALSDFYGFGAVGAAGASTLARGIADAITAAFSVGSPTVTAAASWAVDSYYHPYWVMTLTIDDVDYTSASLVADDALDELGIRVLTGPLPYPSVSSEVVGSDIVHTFRSNGYNRGVWSPGVPGKWTPDTAEIVRRTRSPYSPGTVTRVRLATTTRHQLEYEFVPAAAISSAQRTIAALETRAGYDLTGRAYESFGTLADLIEAAAQGKAMKLWTSETDSYSVDVDADELSTAALFQGTTAGGALGTVTLPLIEV